MVLVWAPIDQKQATRAATDHCAINFERAEIPLPVLIFFQSSAKPIAPKPKRHNKHNPDQGISQIGPE